MGLFSIKLPDVGEGIAEAELVEWHVKIGDVVRADDILGAVMTDKATVEVPSTVDGKVTRLAGEIGDLIAVGSELVQLEVIGEGNTKHDGDAPTPKPKAQTPTPAAEVPVTVVDTTPSETPEPVAQRAAPSHAPKDNGRNPYSGSQSVRAHGEKPLASPSVRQRAREAGIDLRRVRGTGPAGRIGHGDLAAFMEAGDDTAARGLARSANKDVTEVKVVGLRRKISERMAAANTHIPHITIVEEVDVSGVEELRMALNADRESGKPKLTLLPFVMRAIVRAVAEQPALNAHYDDDAGIVRQFGGVHVGIATQTPSGLTVPVIKHVEAMGLWGSAAELSRLAEEARSGTIGREELSGSTITITSLGPLGAIATTPIINRPEVAIVGINKMQMRPVWDGTQFIPRKMMNLSCSFDHRVIDGWDAAVFVQRLKTLLETPGMMFVED